MKAKQATIIETLNDVCVSRTIDKFYNGETIFWRVPMNFDTSNLKELGFSVWERFENLGIQIIGLTIK